MGVEPSAVARVLGIETTFKDLRGGNVLFLPQRIAVIAQGATDSVYATTKYQITNAGQAGSRFGYGSPAHLAAQELFPINGDGVGSIPVTIYPLVDDASGVAAAALITPSGTQTKQASYRLKAAEVISEAFVVAASASVSARCKALGDAVSAVLGMPVKITYTYGTVTASAVSGTGNGTVTTLSVTGNPAPGAWTLVCNTAVANGGVFTLTDPNGTVISTTVTMTPGAGGTTVINQGGIQFTITDGSTDFGVGAAFTITVPATAVVPTVKWKGVSGNDVWLEIVGEDLGTTWAITQPTGGLVNPSIAAALAQVGNVWESMFLNALNIADTTTLDALQTFGEGRWGVLSHKPMVAFTGNTKTLVADATAVSSARRTDRVNAQLVAPGSKELPLVVAARQLARIAKVANENPPTDYSAQQATGLVPGTDGVQWDYAARDQAVKAGSSTIEVVDGVVQISDVVTFYRPTGEDPPAFRYVVDIVKLQTIIYNMSLIFASTNWAGKPLIPDEQPVANPDARKPMHARAALAAMVDGLGLQAIISDPKAAKKTITGVIDSMNPKRLNAGLTVQLSGNSGIVSCDLAFGFYYGALQAA